MIYKYKNFMLAAFEVVRSSFQYFNNCQKLTVVSFIQYFNKNHFSEKKGCRIPLTRVIQDQLTENSTNSIPQSIRLNLDMTLQVKII